MAAVPETRRRPTSFALPDTVVLATSAASSFALVWLVWDRILGLSSGPALLVVWFAVLVAMYWGAVRSVDGAVMAGERLMGLLCASAALVMVVPLVLILFDILRRGISGLTLHFFYQTQEFVGPLSPATAGGAAQAIVGTMEQVGLAILITVPLGILCAIFLNEIGGPLAFPVRIFVDAMSGVPTIVAGLFVYAIWVIEFGWSGFAASLAISISMLPIVTRTSEEVLRLVPDGLREASLALGTSEWRTVWGVVLPTARTGLVTAVVLGIARADRRDGAADRHRLRRLGDEHQPVQRRAGRAAAVHLPPDHAELGREHPGPRLGRMSGADDPRADPVHDRTSDRRPRGPGRRRGSDPMRGAR